ncbi:MAG TPA: endonuclease/exonuclease/phosphatase family protein [Dongiaceae bacterium]|nr:endonuclease/exonuclease/phosphatase family protein [Dongiaceae bacterium]
MKLMTFNLWLGGDQVNFAKAVEAIRASGADIVCLQEPAGNTARIAAALGWPYALPSRHMIARMPLFAPPAARGPDGNELAIAYAETAPGKFVAVCCIHLPSEESGPRALREGRTIAEVLETERKVRLPFIAPYVATAAAMAKTGLPVIVAGDFNAPSPLDGDAVAWPAAQALLDAGFTDSYRAAHPDPKAEPGITWSYGYPYPHLDADGIASRIDFIMTLGAARTVKSEILGDPGMPGTDIPVSPWPSDHRAVVSTLEVAPGPAPAMVSIAERAVARGAAVTLRFHAATADGRIEGGSIVVRGGDAVLMRLSSNDGTDRKGSLAFGTWALAPGRYSAALLDRHGATLAAAPFWVVAQDRRPGIAAAKSRFATGEAIALSWDNAPGNRFDWIGLYRKGEPDAQNYLGFYYVNAEPSGTIGIEPGLAPGEYEARLGLDDSLVALAGAAFTVG